MEWGVNRYLRAPLWAMVSSALLWVALGWGFLLVIGQQSGDTVGQLLRLLYLHSAPFLVLSVWLFLAGLLMGEILYSHHRKRCLRQSPPVLRLGEGIAIVLPLARWKRSLLFLVALSLVLGMARLWGISTGIYQLASGGWRDRVPAVREQRVSPAPPKEKEEEKETPEEPPAVDVSELPPGVNPELPVHRRARLHPELFDPVLGDQAAIVEWAWSPAYAKRFHVKEGEAELEDGLLWLVGVKVMRMQYRKWQRYQCRIVGLIDNRLPVVWPPGEQYMVHPDYNWFGGLPGRGSWLGELKTYTPGQAAWHKFPKNRLEEERPEMSITVRYLFWYRHYTKELGYFEVDAACGYFLDPKRFRNELRLPTEVVENHPNRTAAFETSAFRIVLPDGLMRRIYPYVAEARAWDACFVGRVEERKANLPDWAKTRFEGLCERKEASRRE